MEVNDLINLDPLSPVLPLQNNSGNFQRLSDVNNPFDNLLKKSMIPNNNTPETKKCNLLFNENKENLISPLKTPKSFKKFNKLSNSPLFLKNTKENPQNIVRKDLINHLDLNDTKSSETSNNTSLQFFDDSFINNSLNCALIASNDWDSEKSSNKSDKNESVFQKENDKSAGSDLVDKLKSLEGKNIMSFLLDHQDEISKIASNLSKFDTMTLDDGVIMTSSESDFCRPFRRRCMSASKPTRPKMMYDITRKQLNNSISGFDSEKFDQILNKSLVRKKADGSFVQEKQADLDSIAPPWEEDDSILSLDENICKELRSTPTCKKSSCKDEAPKTDEKLKIPDQNLSSDDHISPIKSAPESPNNSLNINESFTISVDENIKIEINEKNIKMTNKGNEVVKNSPENFKDIIKNIKELIHTKSNGSFMDEKKMGEDFIQTLAKALDYNLDKSFQQNDTKTEQNTSKSSNETKKNLETANTKLINDKPKIKNIESKLKLQPIKNEKLQVKNLRPKIENEKASSRGPLKAIIPVKNMEKNTKSLLSRASLQPLKPIVNVVSTPEVPVKKISRTSTPLLVPSKPQAQSTPHFQKNPSAQNSVTPIRYQKCSSLPRPSSSPDFNKSISPRDNNSKNSTGSVPNLSVSGPSNSNPTRNIIRRRSASDLKAGKMESNLKGKDVKPSVKRTISFNNKFSK